MKSAVFGFAPSDGTDGKIALEAPMSLLQLMFQADSRCSCSAFHGGSASVPHKLG